MAYAVNTIGAQAFAELAGAVSYTTEEIEVFSRAGVDGIGIRLLGSRPKPFTLISKRYHATFAAAHTAIGTTYPAMIGTSVALTIKDEGLGNYYVLGVAEVATIHVLNPTGNVPASTDYVHQTCRWTLVKVS